MRPVWFVGLVGLAAFLTLQVIVVTPAKAEPPSFNDPNFQIVWGRTDKPVEMFTVSRSYMWGPTTLPSSPSIEPYVNSPGGMRVVQYFDKSRMEVNNPNGNRSNLFFVTNGLLVREMVSGLLQLGDTSFQSHPASLEAVAGDPATVNPDSPNYGSFNNVASLNNDNPSSDRTGQPVVETINKAGAVSTIASPDPSVTYAFFDPNLKHNIPNKMNDFLNQSGPVFVNGAIAQDQVINPVFLAGLPITEPYWVKAKVGGVEKDVLVQLYERRVLTYTPSNPPGFQVEMGNVGQHYLRWRYGGGTVGQQRIAFTSSRAGGAQIFTMRTDGGDVKQLTATGGNFKPRWSPDNARLVFISDRDGNGEIYLMNADGSEQQRLTFSPGVDEDYPDWNADGSKIFFSRAGEIWRMTLDGGNQKQLTNTPPFVNLFPHPSPDGQKVAFSTNRDGNFEVYTMNPDGSGLARLTFNASSEDVPTDWKDNRILFQSQAGPVSQFWIMNGDGSNQGKIEDGTDIAPALSPDLMHIVFVAQLPSAGLNIFIMNSDGSNRFNLTDTVGVINTFPDWSN